MLKEQNGPSHPEMKKRTFTPYATNCKSIPTVNLNFYYLRRGHRWSLFGSQEVSSQKLLLEKQ